MRIYDDNDMDAAGMESAKAKLDALVEELKTAGASKVSERQRERERRKWASRQISFTYLILSERRK